MHVIVAGFHVLIDQTEASSAQMSQHLDPDVYGAPNGFRLVSGEKDMAWVFLTGVANLLWFVQS